LSTAVRAGKSARIGQTPRLSKSAGTYSGWLPPIARRQRHPPPRRAQGLHASRAHLPRAPVGRGWADPCHSKAHTRLAHPRETEECSLKRCRWRVHPQTVGGAPDGMSIRRAKVAREHVPKTAASESASLIGKHGPGCPEAPGEGEGKGRKQQQRTGGNGFDREWCRSPVAQGRGGERRLGSQPSSPPRSGRNGRTCSLSICLDTHHVIRLTAYSSDTASNWRKSGSSQSSCIKFPRSST